MNSKFLWILTVVMFVVVAASLGACTTSTTASPYRKACTTDDECAKDERCVGGVCIQRVNTDGDEEEVAESESEADSTESIAERESESSDEDAQEADESISEQENLDEEVQDRESDVEYEQEVEDYQELEEEEPPEPPDNDSCENATEISLSDQWQQFDSTGATNSGISSITEECTGRVQGGPDVFFKIHLEKDNPVILAVRPLESFDMDLSIAVIDSCNAEASCTIGVDARFPKLDWISFNPVETADYYIAVGTSASAEYNPGNLDLYGGFELLAAHANPKDQCAPCSDDFGLGFEFCGYGAGCYEFIYDSNPAEKSCLRKCESDDDCGVMYACRSVPTVEGVGGKYCVPSYSGMNYATCSAIREMGQSCNDALPGANDDDQCGADDLQVIHDAECVTTGIPPSSKCALPCQGEEKKCPEGFSCKNVLLVGDFCLP